MSICARDEPALPAKSKQTLLWLFLLPIVMVALVTSLINLWSLNTLNERNYTRAEITQKYFVLLLETAQLGRDMADTHLLATDSLNKAVAGALDEGALYLIHSKLVDALAELGEKTKLLSERSEVASWAQGDAQVMVEDFDYYRNFMVMATDIAAIEPQTAKLYIGKARDLFMDMVKCRQAISAILTENAQQQNLANRQSMVKIFQQVMRVSILGLLVMLLVSIFLSQLLSRWLSRIIDALRYLAQTQATAKVLPEMELMQKQGVGEFKEMAGAVLVFRQAIQERYAAEAKLKAYQNSLEDLVYERTSELTLTSERLQKAQKIAHLGSWEWHISNDEILCSDEVYRIYGLNPEGKKIDFKTSTSMVHFDDRSAVNQILNKALNSEQDSYDIEYRIVRPDGSLRFVHAQGEMFLDDSGNPYKMLGTFLDITEHKKNEQNLIEAREDAESATRVKDEFLANMSHEIRTPMNAITGFTELVLETELSPKQTDYLCKIQQSTSALLVVIDEILDFSKIKAGALELEEINFRPATIIHNISTIFSSQSNDKGLNLVFDLDSRLPKVLRGDSRQINQVLVNLTSNAIKFTEQGEVKVSIAEVGRDDSAVKVKFSLRDSGIGIEKDTLQRIFTSFTQADNSTTRKYGGTGLGLTICAQLIKLMGGKIAVESTPGQGSLFFFTLDLAVGDGGKTMSGESLDLPVEVVVNRKAPAILRGCRVLLVEDNLINQQVALEKLKKIGLIVELAVNGREAVKAAAERDYDAILMDIQMPVMDGLTAATLIRKEEAVRRGSGIGRRVPIIAMTANIMCANDMAEDEKKSLAAGMDAHIGKPIDIESLDQTLINCIAPERVKRAIPAVVKGDKLALFPDSLPGLELAKGLQNLEGNLKLYKKLLRSFLSDNLTTVSQVKTALVQNDRAKVRLLIHTIKGVAGNLGAFDLQKAAALLEEPLILSETSNLDDHFTQLFDDFSYHLQRVMESIKKLPLVEEETKLSKPLDLEKVKLQLAELDELLQRSDFQALARFNELKPALLTLEVSGTLKKLEHAIESFAFQPAREELVVLQQKM